MMENTLKITLESNKLNHINMKKISFIILIIAIVKIGNCQTIYASKGWRELMKEIDVASVIISSTNAYSTWFNKKEGKKITTVIYKIKDKWYSKVIMLDFTRNEWKESLPIKFSGAPEKYLNSSIKSVKEIYIKLQNDTNLKVSDVGYLQFLYKDSIEEIMVDYFCVIGGGGINEIFAEDYDIIFKLYSISINFGFIDKKNYYIKRKIW